MKALLVTKLKGLALAVGVVVACAGGAVVVPGGTGSAAGGPGPPRQPGSMRTRARELVKQLGSSMSRRAGRGRDEAADDGTESPGRAVRAGTKDPDPEIARRCDGLLAGIRADEVRASSPAHSAPTRPARGLRPTRSGGGSRRSPGTPPRPGSCSPRWSRTTAGRNCWLGSRPRTGPGRDGVRGYEVTRIGTRVGGRPGGRESGRSPRRARPLPGSASSPPACSWAPTRRPEDRVRREAEYEWLLFNTEPHWLDLMLRARKWNPSAGSRWHGSTPRGATSGAPGLLQSGLDRHRPVGLPRTAPGRPPDRGRRSPADDLSAVGARRRWPGTAARPSWRPWPGSNGRPPTRSIRDIGTSHGGKPRTIEVRDIAVGGAAAPPRPGPTEFGYPAPAEIG